MRYGYYLVLFFGRFILFPIYFLSGLLPRDQKLWVFGSWGGYRFADNAAAFFIYCQKRIAKDVHLVWISRDRSIISRLRERGFVAHWLWSPLGMVACLRAGLHLFDCFPKDTNFWLSRGSKRINLWSGVPLKVFERDIDVPSNRYFRLFHGNFFERLLYGMMMPWHLVRPDLIIATSDEMAKITSRAFDLPPNRVRVTGFPRNDVLFRPRKSDLGAPVPVSLQRAANSGATTYLYLPTFRDSNKSYMNIDWEELDRLMREIGGIFFFKTHPMDRLTSNVDFKNIVELPQKMDVYNALLYSSVLISDYSSIIFDYMLLDRPIIYYMPDLEEFIEGSRSLNFDPTELAVGPICKSFPDLLNAIETVSAGDASRYRECHKDVMPRIHSFRDGDSCKRVLEIIRNS